MIKNILLHATCIVRKPTRGFLFHCKGIARELALAYYLSTPATIRTAYLLSY